MSGLLVPIKEKYKILSLLLLLLLKIMMIMMVAIIIMIEKHTARVSDLNSIG